MASMQGSLQLVIHLSACGDAIFTTNVLTSSQPWRCERVRAHALTPIEVRTISRTFGTYATSRRYADVATGLQLVSRLKAGEQVL